MWPPKVDALIKTGAYVGVWFLASVVVGLFGYRPVANQLGLEAPTLSWPWVTLEGVAFLVAVLAASAYGLKLLDRRPWASVGMRLYPKTLFELGLGVLLGAGMVVALWVVDALWRWAGEGAPIQFPGLELELSQLPLILVFMAFVAFNEEVLVRGFPLQKLIRGFGVSPGVVATSIAFGLFHATGDPWNTAVVVLDTAFAGALFAVCYLKTKSLWMPMGVHFANNVVIFLLDNPALDAINLIPPEMSRDVFFQWWWMNFPVYAVGLLLLGRWRYQPNVIAASDFNAYVNPVQQSSAEVAGRDAEV